MEQIANALLSGVVSDVAKISCPLTLRIHAKFVGGL